MKLSALASSFILHSNMTVHCHSFLTNQIAGSPELPGVILATMLAERLTMTGEYSAVPYKFLLPVKNCEKLRRSSVGSITGTATENISRKNGVARRNELG